MQHDATIRSAIETLEHDTGVIIPVYFGRDTDIETGAALLRATVEMVAREVTDPQAICLSVDGHGPGLEIAGRVSTHFGTRLTASPKNGGKLAGLRNGLRELIGVSRYRYFAAIDQDGDHFANELLNFVRMAEDIAQTMSTDRIVVLGNRLSPHRSLGFLRAEGEDLANRVMMDALAYDAAVSGQPLRLQFANVIDDIPDFHAGYKFFSRTTAEAVFLTPPQLAGCSEDTYYRHACEAVMSVEAIKSGAILATVNRRSFDEQPISIFASINRSRLTADLIIWPCKRLAIPGPFVAQWLDNHLPQLLLGTLSPQGRDELLAVRTLVLQAFDMPAAGHGFPPIIRPRFV